MPKVELEEAPVVKGSDYPDSLDAPCASRVRSRLGFAGGLTSFGVNLTCLPPGCWSSQRHWHSHEDEFVFIVSGEAVLIEDDGETVLQAGECAAFPAGKDNGHHLVNRSEEDVMYLEIGSSMDGDEVTYSDVDMRNVGGRFVRKDGTPRG